MENVLKALLQKEKQILFAYLFGSRAAGDGAYPPRDIDVAVYFQPKGTPFSDSKIDLHGALSRALKTNDIDIVVLNSVRNLVLLEEIVRKGMVLIDRDPEFREQFEQKILHQAIDFRTRRRSLMGV